MKSSVKQSDVKVNSEICGLSDNVRVLVEDGAVVRNLGEVIEEAAENDEDVIQVSCGKDMPVVKVMELSKYLYSLNKKNKQLEKKNKANNVENKTIRISYLAEENDVNTKVKNIKKIIDRGDNVSIEVQCKGRLIAHINEFGPKKMADVLDRVGVYDTVAKPKISGYSYVCTIRKSK